MTILVGIKKFDFSGHGLQIGNTGNLGAIGPIQWAGFG
jgi:hypothetical protein